jgi:16S rRNA pseudouridine516 synthase
MFAAVGNHVVALHRESIGPLSLDADLQPGQWRKLSQSEVEALAEAESGLC